MDTFDVSLTTLTYGGDALGRLPDGRAVFVPFGLPGETVRLQITAEKRGHARAELLEVRSPAPDRIAPRCPHFPPLGDCGGCHYQHLSYESQLRAKQTILRDQLERIGGIANPPVALVVPSPNPWNYRNHVQFHLTPEGRLGFGAARSNTVIAIQECHLPEPALNFLWPQLDLEAIPGLDRVGLRLGADDDMMLVLESQEPLDFTVEDLPLSAVQLGPRGTMVLAGSDALTLEVRGRLFRVSAESFFQVNTSMAEAMVEHLLHELPPQIGVALDLYCGVGLFSAFLAPRAARLIGVEISPAACADFTVNLDAFDHVELYESPVEDALPALRLRPDLILLDPPRSGVDRRTLDAILILNASQIVYISCDPATLARDARRLIQGGYHLRQITPFDLFPQTYHIESISFWEK
jgi:23S rRNA (uracil1939-C5)-methyltransferase